MKRTVKTFTIYGVRFKLDGRYEPIRPLGKGSYGIVCAARNVATGNRVAIKRISPIARKLTDAKHVLREIRLMHRMGHHPNIISLQDVIISVDHDELYLIMDCMDTDLHKVIQSSQALTESHYKYFLHQILRGVKYLHDNQILHRDLKPGNLLVTKSCCLKIGDFGLARKIPELAASQSGNPRIPSKNQPMTEHVVTRWYRSPELMLQPDGLYSYSVDMWSIGCIFAEMLGRKAIFPGKNFVHQLTLIFDVIGSPALVDIEKIKSSQAQKFLRSLGKKSKVPFSSLYPNASLEAIDLLDKMLQFNPRKRCSVVDALNHPFLADTEKKYKGEKFTQKNNVSFEFENQDFSRSQLKKMILTEVKNVCADKSQEHRQSQKDRIDNNESDKFRFVRREPFNRKVTEENKVVVHRKVEVNQNVSNTSTIIAKTIPIANDASVTKVLGIKNESNGDNDKKHEKKAYQHPTPKIFNTEMLELLSNSNQNKVENLKCIFNHEKEKGNSSHNFNNQAKKSTSKLKNISSVDKSVEINEPQNKEDVEVKQILKDQNEYNIPKTLVNKLRKAEGIHKSSSRIQRNPVVLTSQRLSASSFSSYNNPSAKIKTTDTSISSSQKLIQQDVRSSSFPVKNQSNNIEKNMIFTKISRSKDSCSLSNQTPSAKDNLNTKPLDKLHRNHSTPSLFNSNQASNDINGPCVGSASNMIRSQRSRRGSVCSGVEAKELKNKIPHDHTLKKKKKVTIPMSPKFSVMSWQRTKKVR